MPFFIVCYRKFTIHLHRCGNFRLPQSAQHVHPNRERYIDYQSISAVVFQAEMSKI